jgi:hypothetical protein
VKMIISTEYVGLLEQVVELVMHKINAGRHLQSGVHLPRS